MPVLTFYSRMGGKSRIRKEIIAKFPVSYYTYVEPFFGAGHVFFEKERSPVEVINDLDTEVMTIMEDVQVITAEDIWDWEFPESKEYFEALRSISATNPLERLYRFLFLKWTSFAGMGDTYAPTKAYQTATQARIKTFARKLPLIQERLRGVRLYNQDYMAVMKRYDAPDTLFYLDPPYHKTTLKEYKHKYIDIVALRDYLKTIQGKFILSYNDVPYVRELFQDDFKVETIQTRYLIDKNTNTHYRQELLIMNY